MYFVPKVIILLAIDAIIYKCEAYVVRTTQQLRHSNNNELSELGDTNPSALLYIGNMVKPAEIREPSTLQEIINYVGSDKLSQTAVMPELQENQPHILTYTELSKLLAFWQWAKEQNFYEMQTDQKSTNDNLVTVVEK